MNDRRLRLGNDGLTSDPEDVAKGGRHSLFAQPRGLIADLFLASPESSEAS